MNLSQSTHEGFNPGHEVRDRRWPAPWSVGVVDEVLDETAAEVYVDAIGKTVAEDNPGYPATDPVVIVRWNPDDEMVYHFPASRLVLDDDLVDVAPEDLHPSRLHERRFDLEGNLGYVRSVHYRGSIPSVLTGRRVPGGVELIDGHKRRWIARWAALETVAVELVECSDAEARRQYRACHDVEDESEVVASA